MDDSIELSIDEVKLIKYAQFIKRRFILAILGILLGISMFFLVYW